MSAWAVMSVPAPKVWTSTLPVPWALMAVSSAGVVPLWSVMLPAVVRSTMAPSAAVVRTSLCTASMMSAAPATALAPTRLTLRPTSSTVKSSASSR